MKYFVDKFSVEIRANIYYYSCMIYISYYSFISLSTLVRMNRLYVILFFYFLSNLDDAPKIPMRIHFLLDLILRENVRSEDKPNFVLF